MKNRKGFTLIELLAVIVILGVILVIAIPSISAAILNARKNSYVATANEFVDGLRMMTLTNPDNLPIGENKACKNLTDIKLEKGSNTKSPFGKNYNQELSKVCVTYEEEIKEYIYSICILDIDGNGICNIRTEEGTTTYEAIDIKAVTKADVIVGGNIPEPVEPEPEPEVEPMIILSKGPVSPDLYTNITGGWTNKENYTSTNSFTDTFTYNNNKYLSFWAPWSGTQSKIYANNKIDITSYNSITASGYANTDYYIGFDSTMILGVKSVIPTFVNTDLDYSITTQTGVINSTWTSFNLTLDISQLSGEYYIILGVTHGTGTSVYTVRMIVDNITLNP